ncbi:MAG: hypothetical protein H6570_11810 [Lewinellaceae bacterium]|nr:hypothetical protein [Lewinellaceae bacterium]
MYTVIDSTLKLTIIIRDGLEKMDWDVSIPNNDEMIWGACGDEGPFKQKYQRLE